ncbi:phosphoadenosine phosphosulfate reductase family protein [Methylobacterium sp. WL69]|uniref:phosphoadenosine phosphosulfate reductase family protein n=1 Tax=Methylobacterium sp. WL69 TaxID=2603893 RepID=UPI0011C72420|nr:phosphoadenosine phosphosulfate reductase family protein [Methylobacterium sp. WL69]TXM76599.1 phosphoadenosine phosphosulfate reductase family protein [Methylobacterium sp. WL69]
MPGIPTLLVSVCLSGGVPGLRSNLPTTVDVVMPLVSWSEADVFAYVAGHHLALPPQYAEGYSDSVECLIYPPKFRRLGVGDLSGAWIADRADCRSSQGSG